MKKQRSKYFWICMVLLFSLSLSVFCGCEKKSDKDEHGDSGLEGHIHAFDANDKCEECGEAYRDTGLAFAIKKNGEGKEIYIVMGYAGKESRVVIPSKYKGVSVEKIHRDAFAFNEKISVVVIPETVKQIDPRAFSGCKNLKSVSLPSSLEHLGNDAFSMCDQLLQKESGVYYVGNWVVDCDESVTSLTLRAGTVGIAHAALESCANITTVTLPEGLKFIETVAFLNCIGIKEITIPGTVQQIGARAFADCTNLERVYYGGTEEAWKAVVAEEAFPESTTIVFNHNP
jgi:hypothetical protein